MGLIVDYERIILEDTLWTHYERICLLHSLTIIAIYEAR